jgi:hypothetical protein
MKRVIAGKTYNTATATEIASDSFGHGGDFRRWEETLYKSPRGRYFVAGSGGAMTRYARSCGDNTRCGGEGMYILSEDDALGWCEEHGVDADTIAEHFTVEEG